MAVKRSALGNNPLAQGIFSKTEPEEESLIKNQESSTINQESSFLIDGEKEKINLRLSLELNDWLDNLLKQGKRKHGQKIAKEGFKLRSNYFEQCRSTGRKSRLRKTYVQAY